MSAAATAATAVVSSAVVAAIVGPLTSVLTQRYLLDRKAKVDYESMARQRLYETIGPLRMQLLYGASDAAHRISGHVDLPAGRSWDMDPAGYYVRNTIYRLLRPLALAQLIERAMGTADFSVDPDAVDLLKFAATAERMLSGGEIVKIRVDGEITEHPKVDWGQQTEHLLRDNLRATAARLIDESHDKPRVMSFSQFERDIPDLDRDDELEPLAAILAKCKRSMTEKPVLWLRLVGYGYRCRELIEKHGVKIGFAVPPLDPADLLRKTSDEHISTHLDEYVSAIRRVACEDL
jgi:hypothetical protein